MTGRPLPPLIVTVPIDEALAFEDKVYNEAQRRYARKPESLYTRRDLDFCVRRRDRLLAIQRQFPGAMVQITND